MLGFIVYLDKKSLIISKCPIPTQSRVFVHGKQSKFVSSILIEYYEDINVVVSYIQSLYLLPYHSQSGSSHTFPRNKDTILMMLIIVYKCNDILVAVLRNKCYDIYFFYLFVLVSLPKQKSENLQSTFCVGFLYLEQFSSPSYFWF